MRVSSDIPLPMLFEGMNWDQVKIHVAQFNGNAHPLDVFARSFDEWRDKWNGSYQRKHYWNRPLVFSIIELPKQPGMWLFGGVFRVVKINFVRKDKQILPFYSLSDTQYGVPLIGRLVIFWQKDSRPMARLPESILTKMSVAEIRASPYAGEDFPGHSSINHNYAVLESVWNENKPDWRAALEYCSGIYLITDTHTGLRYIGSAYGDDGIYSRWRTYFLTGGHGGNTSLKRLLKKPGVDYARKHFMFTLLEQLPQRYNSSQVVERENYWKQVLLTRGPWGLNDN